MYGFGYCLELMWVVIVRDVFHSSSFIIIAGGSQAMNILQYVCFLCHSWKTVLLSLLWLCQQWYYGYHCSCLAVQYCVHGRVFVKISPTYVIISCTGIFSRKILRIFLYFIFFYSPFLKKEKHPSVCDFTASFWLLWFPVISDYFFLLISMLIEWMNCTWIWSHSKLWSPFLLYPSWAAIRFPF